MRQQLRTLVEAFSNCVSRCAVAWCGGVMVWWTPQCAQRLSVCSTSLTNGCAFLILDMQPSTYCLLDDSSKLVTRVAYLASVRNAAQLSKTCTKCSECLCVWNMFLYSRRVTCVMQAPAHESSAHIMAVTAVTIGSLTHLWVRSCTRCDWRVGPQSNALLPDTALSRLHACSPV